MEISGLYFGFDGVAAAGSCFILWLYFYTCLQQDFQEEWMNRILYFGFMAQASVCAFLYLLFRTSLSGTTAAADFLIRVSHTLYLIYTSMSRCFPQLEPSYTF
ncbi:hypothetical protein [Pontibacter flavimaris]|uniref:Uncharacterized protein n=1 Tax=Pontibacter flavimaris TaxID=1797110 RepID=A0A1Q5P9U7_9BACT|nr:hypothetical protein [Pontibacter flavimaris]OKL38912.1 hypothetical protein A3841_02890 [Pontibacter flavimaris]